MMFSFTVTSSDPSSSARAGIFKTPHGDFQTPCFMPCGTKGAVKTLTPDELKNLGCEMILGNTFHLMLRPGADAVEKMGGLHRWIGWNGPLLTDSGGFQVFSLFDISSACARPPTSRRRSELGLRARAVRSQGLIKSIDEEGVIFQSPIDGATIHLTPEKSIEIQEKLGADIIMAFDDCPPGKAEYEYVRESLKRTHSWLRRCIGAKRRKDQALFPIIQGGIFKDLRIESAKFISEISADAKLPGIAIGGVAVGEPKPFMLDVLETVAPLLPKEKPRYLMGIGEPQDIAEAVFRGMDMFDCVLPTRLARHGSFLTEKGRKDVTRREFTTDEKPIDSKCACYTCRNFSASYLRHLMIEKEMLGHRLLTIHNLFFLLDLMRRIRAEIKAGTFKKFYEKIAAH
jgi:queuine tRNA-ribosyltransferase